jgi:hypothetical protein
MTLFITNYITSFFMCYQYDVDPSLSIVISNFLHTSISTPRVSNDSDDCCSVDDEVNRVKVCMEIYCVFL